MNAPLGSYYGSLVGRTIDDWLVNNLGIERKQRETYGRLVGWLNHNSIDLSGGNCRAVVVIKYFQEDGVIQSTVLRIRNLYLIQQSVWLIIAR